MSPWREKLLGESRTRMLKLLRHVPMTVVEMATAMDLSSNGVRSHLAWLTAHDLVSSVGSHRDTGGKPATLYALTPTGEELFPKAYDLALLGLLDELEENGARAGDLKAVMAAVGQRLGAEVPVPAGGQGRIAAAAEAIRSMGGDVTVEETGRGWRLEGRGCPLSAAVAARPESCELIRAMIARVSGCDTSTCCNHGNQPSCCFEVGLSQDPGGS